MTSTSREKNLQGNAKNASATAKRFLGDISSWDGMSLPSRALNQINMRQITFISGSELSYVLHVSCITIVSYKEVLIGVLFKHKHSFPYSAI